MEQNRHDADELEEFVVQLGTTMNLAGEPVQVVEARLSRIASAYGETAATITAFPTYLMVNMGHGTPVAIALTSTLSGSPRLDRVAAFETLLGQAERGQISPADGLDRLTEIRSFRLRFGRLRSVAGYAVVAMGICLVLRPAQLEVAAAGALGALVGLLRWVGSRQHSLNVMMPIVASFVVAALSALVVKHDLSGVGMRPMVAALVVFLPGVALTTAVLELAAGQVISGASRLVAASVQLAFLAFGILAGIDAVGIPRSRILFGNDMVFGPWSQWLGVLVFGIGVILADAAPRRSLPALLVMLYAAWASQVAVDAVLGGYVAALVGATVMTLTAVALERTRHAMPRRAAFLPGFWLIVPGSLGLVGLTRFAGGAGAHELVVTVGSIFAVALGVLFGTQILAWASATSAAIDHATGTLGERAPRWPVIRRHRVEDRIQPDSDPDQTPS